MNQPLRVIHVEDSVEDSEMVKHLLLSEGLACEIERIETQSQLVDLLFDTECDLILSDCTLPHFSGFKALEIASSLKPQVPFIFVSGTIGEEAAIVSLRNGATDYVLKNRLSRLGPAVRRALAEKEEKATSRALEKRLQQARRLQAISTLAGGVAHDVNNVLTMIQGDAFLLAKECEHSEPAQEIIARLDETARRGSELMQQLLAFARKSEARFIFIDAYQHVKEIVGALRTLLPPGVELTLRMSEGLPAMFADPEHISRSLTNLILNARDAVPEGGHITVFAELVHFDPIPPHLLELEDKSYICLKVVDTGVGMDEATQMRVFEPFFTTKSLAKNAGLGLPEVFGLMRIHNGLIDIQSEPGKGTTVSLFFPLPQDSMIEMERVKKMPPIQMLEVVAPF
jgi:two-component system, cell cycle sensor histidine kinase and response regulator CckA